MNHFTTPEFWFHYRCLPAETRELADRCFAMLQTDPGKTADSVWDELASVCVRGTAAETVGGLDLPSDSLRAGTA